MTMILRMMALGARSLVTDVFTSSTTWVAPAGTTKVETLVGKGKNGTAPHVASGLVNTVLVTYGSGGPGSNPAPGNAWDNLQGITPPRLSQINGGGSVSFYTASLQKYTDGSDTLLTYLFSNADIIPGTATLLESSWETSGVITHGGFQRVSFQYNDPGQSGDPSSAFGYTFSGGTPSVPTAPTLTYNNIAVVPGNSYPITVPPGGSVSITYYK